MESSWRRGVYLSGMSNWEFYEIVLAAPVVGFPGLWWWAQKWDAERGSRYTGYVFPDPGTGELLYAGLVLHTTPGYPYDVEVDPDTH